MHLFRQLFFLLVNYKTIEADNDFNEQYASQDFLETQDPEDEYIIFMKKISLIDISPNTPIKESIRNFRVACSQRQKDTDTDTDKNLNLLKEKEMENHPNAQLSWSEFAKYLKESVQKQKCLDLNFSLKEKFSKQYNDISAFGKNYNKEIDKNLFLALWLVKETEGRKEINSLSSKLNIDIHFTRDLVSDIYYPIAKSKYYFTNQNSYKKKTENELNYDLFFLFQDYINFQKT